MIATVVPDVPSFAVDAGFRYRVPERMRPRVSVGSRVRIPLGGRRTGGTVIGLASEEPAEPLRDIAGVSGATPVFDDSLAAALQWAAFHYVAPLSVMLRRAAPPNVTPPPPPDDDRTASRYADGPQPVLDRADPLHRSLIEAVAGRRSRPTVWLAALGHEEWIDRADRLLAERGRSLLVVVPTAAEVRRLAGRLDRSRLVVVDSEMDDATLTQSWGRAAHRGGLVIGTPRVAAWPVADLAAVALIEDGRRAMKDRQSPTVHARDLLRARAQRRPCAIVVAGPTPSLEALAWGPEIIRPSRRAWTHVEIVDRREDPPGGGVVASRSMAAIRAVAKRGGRVFVFAHRRGYSAAARCVRCRTLRRCPSCGSRPDPGDECRRCGAALGECVECGGGRFEPLGAGVGRVIEEIARSVGRDQVGAHPAPTPITVGSERDLAELEPVDLTVAIDLDGLIFGPNYRAAEEALRIGARLASALGRGSGRRLMAQTADPTHPVIDALRTGDPTVFAGHELPIRESLRYPPSGSLIVIEARAADDGALKQVDVDIGEIGKADVLGPAPTADGLRWLIQGGDLGSFRTGLRPAVQRWRDARVTVRIDVDPIDL